MATIKPVIANNLTELEVYVKNSNKVILVVNKDLIPQIKRRVKEDQYYNKNTSQIVKGAAIAAGAFVLAPIAGPIVSAGLALTFLGSVFATARQIWKRIATELQDYTWSDTTLENGVNVLVLTKSLGENKLHYSDVIDFESIVTQV